MNKLPKSRILIEDKKISRLAYDYCIIRGVSGKELAKYLGLSVQQIQKYLKCTNRISAGNLEKIVNRLQIPVEQIFKNTISITCPDFKLQTELVEQFSKIKDESIKKVIINLVKNIVLSE